jgi:sodium/potassium-transporting ATPase subunit alpha
MVPRKCMAVREGTLKAIDAITLVPGDVVCLRMGDKIPADTLVFHVSDFKVFVSDILLLLFSTFGLIILVLF